MNSDPDHILKLILNPFLDLLQDLVLDPNLVLYQILILFFHFYNWFIKEYLNLKFLTNYNDDVCKQIFYSYTGPMKFYFEKNTLCCCLKSKVEVPAVLLQIFF
jgi:hypothetical protein